MKADQRFAGETKKFWAYVRSISESLKYTKNKEVIAYDINEICTALIKLDLSISEVYTDRTGITPLGQKLVDYFEYRKDVLNNKVEKFLMNASEARELFEKVSADFTPRCPVPMNKQTGEKGTSAFFTGIINILIDKNIGEIEVNYNPQQLTAFTMNGFPVRTFARRVDGCIPSIINPIAIWEIKEYYYTTTFGSRVADGIYETLLDGLECEDLKIETGRDLENYLFIDAKGTWWDKGRSYLCRIIDMLNMGYITEAIFGCEVEERVPEIAKNWQEKLRQTRELKF